MCKYLYNNIVPVLAGYYGRCLHDAVQRIIKVGIICESYSWNLNVFRRCERTERTDVVNLLTNTMFIFPAATDIAGQRTI